MKTKRHTDKTYDMYELCDFINWLHRRVWTVMAIAVAIGAIFCNPGHLLTAALLLLFSRAEYEVNDLKALK